MEQRQCRICFDTEDQENLVSPCLCRGSAEYIHKECLERYIQHYPDGICRVCLTPFEVAQKNQLSAYYTFCIAFVAFILFLMSPSVHLISKVLLFILMSCVLSVYWRMNWYTPLIVLSSIAIMLMFGFQSAFRYSNREPILIFVSMLLIYTLFLYIPQPYLMFLMVIVMVCCYTYLVLMIALENLDAQMTGLFFVTVFLLWNVVTIVRPPLRFNNR
jgi:hypothetical protein